MPTYVLSLIGREARAGMSEALPEGLRLGHLAVLGALAEGPSQSQRDLGAALSIHATDLVAVLDDLVDRSLAEREMDATDRRRRLVRITPAGRELVDRATAQSEAVVDGLLGGLEEPDRDAVLGLLRTVLRERPAAAPARQERS